MKLVAAAFSLATAALAALALAGASAPPVAQRAAAAPIEGNGCLACHAGIEDIHPKAQLSCVDCHGGDPNATRKSDAHVQPSKPPAGDERVAPRDEDLAWRRFKNPMDLRVARQTCGECHESTVRHVELSLHATTGGHLSDGYYEMGLSKQKGARFAVFPTVDEDAKKGELAQLLQLPAFDERGSPSSIATHFTDLARKECSQCHLWSSGRAVRGRVGFDGDYRGEGCAACHLPYALDGLSRSADASISKVEPGHPREHRMTRAPTTQACTTCHWGDAAIGLDFRGLAQLPPGAPGGPEIPGTTAQLLNRQFYLSDPAINPPDVHHERGMHCIDCHTENDVMGDGALHGHMEHAVEISCSDCHGTFDALATLTTERGTELENLRREGDRVILRSKVTGKDHDVVQVAHVLDPKHPEFNPRAAKAMTKEHGELECYACHAGWNPNFLGFHFDRNASLTQLDLLSGKRTSGRVTTQEKVFATWKSFYAGKNEEGRIAPYLTGFSAFGSYIDESGERVLDQVMPVTAAGLSGVTMIHHQVHTTRSTARSCIECHRTSTTWGMGSSSFELARQLAFVADRRGIEVVALDRQKLAASVPLMKLVQPDLVSLALDVDPLQGFARTLFAAEEQRGVHAIDVREPTAPKRRAFVATVDPRHVETRAGLVFVADGAGGLRILDGEKPAELREVGRFATLEARHVALQWPFAYVADGPGGVWFVDVRDPKAPKLAGGAGLEPADGGSPSIAGVDVLFQYSRPRAARLRDGGEATSDRRTPARLLLAAVDEDEGLILVDATDAVRPKRLFPEIGKRSPHREADIVYRAVLLRTRVDLAQPQGGQRTQERDYAYVLAEHVTDVTRDAFVEVYDVTDPSRAKRLAQHAVGRVATKLAFASFYNPPFVASTLLVANADSVAITDVSVSAQPTSLGALPAMLAARAIAVEGFHFDRMLDDRGRPEKDVSHAESRWLTLPEIARVLDVPTRAFGVEATPEQDEPHAAGAARAEFTKLDADGSGFLDEREAGTTLFGADGDSDGRVSLAELARRAAKRERNSQPRMTTSERTAEPPKRNDADGDLAKLFDGVDPHAFDKDQDGRLARGELDRAFFAALDLDGDGKLGQSEVSRTPGSARELRFGGPDARALFATFDGNRDGRVQPNELRASDADWSALDVDGNGWLQLATPRAELAKKGAASLPSEWPARRPFTTLLAPTATREQVLAAFDRDGDGRLSRKELEKRPDLLADLDDDQSGAVEPNELKTRTDVLIGSGVNASSDGFRSRWDLDGDGKVEAEELAVPAWLRARLLPKSR